VSDILVKEGLDALTALGLHSCVQVITGLLASAAHQDRSARRALSSAGHCGDGNLAEMITRALREAKAAGRAEVSDVYQALHEADGALPEELVGTVAARVAILREQLAAAHAEIGRLREVATRIENDRHAAASELIESDLAHGVYRVRMEAQLAIVTTARDALADIADDLNGDNGDDEELVRRREEIASLRALEKTVRKGDT